MRLIMGTSNQAKVAQLAPVLSQWGIQLEALPQDQYPTIEENGTTALENAILKAEAYASHINTPVLSIDNALYFDKLPAEQQPGLHVRRIGGKKATTDAELLANTVELIKPLGETTTGYWEYGVCISDGRNRWTTTIKTPRLFVTTPSPVTMPGYPLESIQQDPATGKYISEMNETEKAAFWQSNMSTALAPFIQQFLNSRTTEEQAA
jgi:XTP/dITP diphosphohydrolase